ncbi:MAG: outer membrane protein assembly factor BamD [Proteobacteria bacterium]|nr:outer membrane protein assembly factor BamD [Pseudomonadota bacterium]
MKIRFSLMIICVIFLISCSVKQQAPTPEALYKEAVEASKSKDYLTSIESYKKVKELFPEHPLSQIAQLEIAETYFNSEQYDEAVMAYDEFVKLYPGNINVPYARFKEALCYFNQMSNADRDQSMTRKAVEKLEKFIKDFSDTPYAVKAHNYLKLARKRLAEQEIFIANFYMKSGRYRAAERRYMHVLKFFADVEIQESALIGLYNLYKITGETTKAQEIKNTLEFFFPNSVLKKNIS